MDINFSLTVGVTLLILIGIVGICGIAYCLTFKFNDDLEKTFERIPFTDEGINDDRQTDTVNKACRATRRSGC